MIIVSIDNRRKVVITRSSIKINEDDFPRKLCLGWLTSLDMSEVDTVWTRGGQTSTPPISKYLIKKSG